MRNQVVSRGEGLEARPELLAAEKEFTGPRDALTRRHGDALGARGKVLPVCGAEWRSFARRSLRRRSRLIVYHFMYGPDWEEGCKSCSLE
jgi:predicted dithiol-disulfide oxidoreductase (DUF899 family)